jgi:hypothetical protein
MATWSRILLEKLIIVELVKKFSSVHGTRRSITVFTRTRHLSLSWTRLIRSTALYSIYLRCVLVLSSHLHQSICWRLHIFSWCLQCDSEGRQADSVQLMVFWEESRNWISTAILIKGSSELHEIEKSLVNWFHQFPVSAVFHLYSGLPTAIYDFICVHAVKICFFRTKLCICCRQGSDVIRNQSSVFQINIAFLYFMLNIFWNMSLRSADLRLVKEQAT